MRPFLLLVAVAATAAVAVDAASARGRHRPMRCDDRPYEFSWIGVLTNPPPGPNGCAPAVYQHGRYVGQDPDPNIRFQLRRDPATGYGAGQY